MRILTSPGGARHPAPRRILPIAGARSIGDGIYEIAVQPGACAADVSAALDVIPLDATFVEIYDDADTVLIFQQAPPAAASAYVRTPVRPASPRPTVAVAPV
jgi:uncharacterized repeat protein (TIGR03917 family)